MLVTWKRECAIEVGNPVPWSKSDKNWFTMTSYKYNEVITNQLSSLSCRRDWSNIDRRASRRFRRSLSDWSFDDLQQTIWIRVEIHSTRSIWSPPDTWSNLVFNTGLDHLSGGDQTDYCYQRFQCWDHHQLEERNHVVVAMDSEGTEFGLEKCPLHHPHHHWQYQ